MRTVTLSASRFVAVAIMVVIALAALVSLSLAENLAPRPVTKPEMRESCPGLVAGLPPHSMPAAYRTTALNADRVRLIYVGHATFLIESPQGVRIATDYNDYVRSPVVPDIVTMNHAHSTHYTDHPDPAIKYVLRGWADGDRPARYDLAVRDVRVRNVPTNIRTWHGDTERHGNSIFVFEIATLCIAHLGHLHHTLTQAQLDELGHVDVVMAPVDGTYTLDLDGMVEVLQALKAPLIIPMHYFSAYTLDRFLARVGRAFAIERHETPSVSISKAELPTRPKVLVLPGH